MAYGFPEMAWHIGRNTQLFEQGMSVHVHWSSVKELKAQNTTCTFTAGDITLRILTNEENKFENERVEVYS